MLRWGGESGLRALTVPDPGSRGSPLLPTPAQPVASRPARADGLGRSRGAGPPMEEDRRWVPKRGPLRFRILRVGHD